MSACILIYCSVLITFRLLFFCDNTHNIYKASLDGTNVTQIVSVMHDVIGLDVDFSTNRICWVNHCKYHLIASINSSACRWWLRVTDETDILPRHVYNDKQITKYNIYPLNHPGFYGALPYNNTKSTGNVLVQ